MSTLTIGEVLNRLKDEFEDITISKIRFLESEGLVTPDRTESGYRQFDDDDVERLRYVLRTQRDRYLPLKVIREELERIDAGEQVRPAPPPPPPNGADDAAEETPSTGSAGDRAAERPSAAMETDPAGVDLSLDELRDACGLTTAQIRALREHGVLEGEDRFDGDDLRIAEVAARLIELGLEPRHLRMYGQFADRESALYEQLIAPLLRQRNPDSRRRASEQTRALAGAGRDLHSHLLTRELRRIVGT